MLLHVLLQQVFHGRLALDKHVHQLWTRVHQLIVSLHDLLSLVEDLLHHLRQAVTHAGHLCTDQLQVLFIKDLTIGPKIVVHALQLVQQVAQRHDGLGTARVFQPGDVIVFLMLILVVKWQVLLVVSQWWLFLFRRFVLFVILVCWLAVVQVGFVVAKILRRLVQRFRSICVFVVVSHTHVRSVIRNRVGRGDSNATAKTMLWCRCSRWQHASFTGG